jgi:hypothetical protein
MLYVERSKDGRIIALHSTSTPAAREQKPLMDEEVLAFFSTTNSWEQLIAMSDFGTVRIIEDLIDILIRKNIIHFTELPEHAQQRIMERKQLREKIVSQDLLVHDII